jgi:hypothetical protein
MVEDTYLDLLEEWGGGDLVGGVEEAVHRGPGVVACAGLHDGAEDLHLVHLAARHQRQNVVAQLGDGLKQGERERGGVREAGLGRERDDSLGEWTRDMPGVLAGRYLMEKPISEEMALGKRGSRWACWLSGSTHGDGQARDEVPA